MITESSTDPEKLQLGDASGERSELGLGSVRPDREYYQFTFTVDADGVETVSVDTGWVGHTDDDLRLDIRQARLANAESARVIGQQWAFLGWPYVIVNTDVQLLIFLAALGGHALIAKEVAERYLSEFLQSHRYTRGPSGGLINIDKLPKPSDVLRRNPKPKHRGRVLRRDLWRCKLCGRRPADYIDLELHLHHIRPWEKGGITDDWNLITLCKTCHAGLDPHEEPELWSFIGQPVKTDYAQYDRDYWEGVRRYRAACAQQLEEWRKAGGVPVMQEKPKRVRRR